MEQKTRHDRPKGIYERRVKRLLDVAISGTALVALSPIMGATALLIHRKLGSPIIFHQDRPGKDERVFRLYKFRSMTDERDESGNLLPDDRRLTRFGKLLRRTSIDELPELWNILRGDMSLVGPRPLLIRYLPYYTPEERHRHDVRPGLTGLAQVNGRNSLSWEEKFAFDLAYVRDVSFKNDAKIILKTIGKVLRRSDVLTGAALHKVAGPLDRERVKKDKSHEG
ncbi:MAG: sugar transferase [Myxococcaceae bacterium]|nr:sugar transferase [Myxococcaceae bacterium]